MGRSTLMYSSIEMPLAPTNIDQRRVITLPPTPPSAALTQYAISVVPPAIWQPTPNAFGFTGPGDLGLAPSSQPCVPPCGHVHRTGKFGSEPEPSSNSPRLMPNFCSTSVA